MQFSFKRIGIVDRGEPARRLITAVRELDAEHGCNLRTIALYTEPDRHAMFVRDADEAFALGPSTYLDPCDNERKSSYLDYARLEEATAVSRDLCRRLAAGFGCPDPVFVPNGVELKQVQRQAAGSFSPIEEGHVIFCGRLTAIKRVLSWWTRFTERCRTSVPSDCTSSGTVKRRVESMNESRSWISRTG